MWRKFWQFLILMYNLVVYGILFFHRSTSLTLLQTERQTDIVCADYFKVIIFWKKQIMKNGSFTNFWFVRSKNWFAIYELLTLNSNSGVGLSSDIWRSRKALKGFSQLELLYHKRNPFIRTVADGRNFLKILMILIENR